MIILVDISVFEVCLFLWTCVLHRQRNCQRITSHPRRSQGITDEGFERDSELFDLANRDVELSF
jgi:hypothetical protein